MFRLYLPSTIEAMQSFPRAVVLGLVAAAGFISGDAGPKSQSPVATWLREVIVPRSYTRTAGEHLISNFSMSEDVVLWVRKIPGVTSLQNRGEGNHGESIVRRILVHEYG